MNFLRSTKISPKWLLLLGFCAVASFAEGPCDIYATAGTPCVAAHSTVRALYANYSGALYQVRRKSDGKTKDIGVLSAGGYVDVATQDSFLTGTTGTISIIYDQSSQHNNLVKSPAAHLLASGGIEADAAQGKIYIEGHVAHGIYVTDSSGVAYRNNATTGIATGDQAESMYMVVDGKRSSAPCCFDYGNAETNGNDDGAATMEAIYWGTDWLWGGHGNGNGPWVAADLEEGMFKSDTGGRGFSNLTWSNDKSVVANYATAMLKGPSGNKFGLKAGNAQSGSLVTMWNGARPAGYSPMKKQGAIILGTGGDGSDGGTGTFFEGAMTKGCPPDSIDNKIQANIIAAGYGDTTVATTLVKHGAGSSSQTIEVDSSLVSFYYAWTGATSVSVAGLPSGIHSTISATAQTVTLTGAPTVTGTFTYTITTVGGTSNVSATGTFSVIDSLSSSSVSSSSRAVSSSVVSSSSSNIALASSSSKVSSSSTVSASSSSVLSLSSSATSISNSTTFIMPAQQATHASILFANDVLYAKGVQGNLAIFNIYGLRLALLPATVSGAYPLHLSPGVYIVRANGLTTTIAVANR